MQTRPRTQTRPGLILMFVARRSSNVAEKIRSDYGSQSLRDEVPENLLSPNAGSTVKRRSLLACF